MGYRIKLLGVARKTDFGLEQRVHPAMVRTGTPISQIEGVFNAVVADGDQVDTTLHSGSGCRRRADRERRGFRHRGSRTRCRATRLHPAGRAPDTDSSGSYGPSLRGAYYIRLMVVDQPGVLADVSALMRDT